MSLNWTFECLLAQLLQQQKFIILMPFVLLYNLHLRFCSSYQKGQMFFFSPFNEKVWNNLWPETFAFIVYAYSSQFNEAIPLQLALESMPIVWWLTMLCIKLSKKKIFENTFVASLSVEFVTFFFALTNCVFEQKEYYFVFFYCRCNFCCVEISFSSQLFEYSLYLCRSAYSIHSERHGMHAIREKKMKWSSVFVWYVFACNFVTARFERIKCPINFGITRYARLITIIMWCHCLCGSANDSNGHVYAITFWLHFFPFVFVPFRCLFLFCRKRILLYV